MAEAGMVVEEAQPNLSEAPHECFQILRGLSVGRSGQRLGSHATETLGSWPGAWVSVAPSSLAVPVTRRRGGP